MDRLDLMQLFVRVAESGSLTATARDMGIRQPAVSKQLAMLEKSLGTSLLWRTPKKVTLTDAGREFYDAAVRLLEDYETVAANIASGRETARGRLKVVASPTFARVLLSPHLPEFLRAHPLVSVELLTRNGLSQMVEDGIDIAFATGNLGDSSLVARKIGETTTVTVASSRYLARQDPPRSPKELSGHERLTFLVDGEPKRWSFPEAADLEDYGSRTRFQTNDIDQLRAAVLGDMGIAQCPAWLFGPEIASGEVVRLLREYERPKPIYVVRLPTRAVTAKITAFSIFIEEKMAEALREQNLDFADTAPLGK